MDTRNRWSAEPCLVAGGGARQEGVGAPRGMLAPCGNVSAGCGWHERQSALEVCARAACRRHVGAYRRAAGGIGNSRRAGRGLAWHKLLTVSLEKNQGSSIT